MNQTNNAYWRVNKRERSQLRNDGEDIPLRIEKLPHMAKGPVFSLCIGWVATGQKHYDRTPAQVALVNALGTIVRNIYVKPDKTVVSYLTPITNIDEEVVAKYGFQPETAFELVKQALSPDVVLVGYNTKMDIDALGLKRGQHYRKIVDLKKVWQVYNPIYQSYTKFSIDHLIKTVLEDRHEPDAVSQAINYVKLWNYYQRCRMPDHKGRLNAKGKEILESPRLKTRTEKLIMWEGVCLGAKRACVC